MDSVALVFILIGSIVLLVIWGFIASEFRRIATMKGHPETRYFWWTFLTGPIGMLMVVALPQKVEAPVVETPKSDELPDI